MSSNIKLLSYMASLYAMPKVANYLTTEPSLQIESNLNQFRLKAASWKHTFIQQIGKENWEPIREHCFDNAWITLGALVKLTPLGERRIEIGSFNEASVAASALFLAIWFVRSYRCLTAYILSYFNRSLAEFVALNRYKTKGSIEVFRNRLAIGFGRKENICFQYLKPSSPVPESFQKLRPLKPYYCVLTRIPSFDLVSDPTDISGKVIYDRGAITQWLKDHQTSPITGKQVSIEELIEEPIKCQFVHQAVHIGLLVSQGNRQTGHLINPAPASGSED